MIRRLCNKLQSLYERLFKQLANLDIGLSYRGESTVCRIRDHQDKNGAVFIDPKGEIGDFRPEEFMDANDEQQSE